MVNDKRAAILKYFEPFPGWTKWIIGLGALFALIGLANLRSSWLIFLFGAGAVALGIWRIVQWKDKISDHEVDGYLNEDLQSTAKRAREKGGFDLSEAIRDPVVIVGPRFKNTGGARFGFKKGLDGRARFTPVDVTAINFLEHQLVVYQCALDFTTGKPLSESVQEYFYNDVVSVSTQTESVSYQIREFSQALLSSAPSIVKAAMNGVLQVNSAETFSLTTSGATNVRVVLKDPVLIGRLGGGEVPMEGAEAAVQAVRKMLREKKAGALPLRAAHS